MNTQSRKESTQSGRSGSLIGVDPVQYNTLPDIPGSLEFTARQIKCTMKYSTDREGQQGSAINCSINAASRSWVTPVSGDG